MSEWKHWLDEASEADEFERAVLRAGLESDPPETMRDQVWSGLVGALAIAPLATATGAQAVSAKATALGVSKASAVWLAVGKGFAVGVAVYGVAAGVSEISERMSVPHKLALAAHQVSSPRQALRHEQLTATPTPVLSVATTDDTSPAPSAAPRGSSSGALAPAPLNPVAALPSVASFDDSEHSSGTRVSQLEAETRALRRARDELRQGKLADAFATLEASRRQFSAPELYQEHEALMIELLYRSGQVAAAEQRASAFLRRFPESPHAQQIRQFAPK